MIKKYYYDCPIEAMYMAKNFGVEYIEHCISSIAGELSVSVAQNDNREFKIYITPESEHIFEKQGGDLYIHPIFAPEPIQRDNKNFFMPKMETTND